MCSKINQMAKNKGLLWTSKASACYFNRSLQILQLHFAKTFSDPQDSRRTEDSATSKLKAAENSSKKKRLIKQARILAWIGILTCSRQNGAQSLGSRAVSILQHTLSSGAIRPKNMEKETNQTNSFALINTSGWGNKSSHLTGKTAWQG